MDLSHVTKGIRTLVGDHWTILVGIGGAAGSELEMGGERGDHNPEELRIKIQHF